MSLNISTKHHINCNEIILEGSALSDLDFEPLLDSVNKYIDGGESNIIINLEKVKLLNSLGINTLIKIFTRCRNQGGEMYIVNISDKISQVLLLTKLNTVLNIAASLNDAINKFALDNEG